jgi:predicted short-subunit dehydrogenase-like oxidoreductase (DUF2520 family)
MLLERAGHRVVAVTGRRETQARAARYLTFSKFFPWSEANSAAQAGNLVILGVPDDAIAPACEYLTSTGGFHSDQLVLHLSGALGLDVLAYPESIGAQVLSIHPLQTFPDVAEGILRLPGSAMAVTARDEAGFEAGESFARDVRGDPFRLADEVKPLYHAAAVFCSNYLVAVEGMAEQLFLLAGLPAPTQMFAPLARSALEATLAMGAEPALTGPAARGDVGTIERNLEALVARAPHAVLPYVVLANMALDLAVSGEKLSEERAKEVREVLDRWR